MPIFFFSLARKRFAKFFSLEEESTVEALDLETTLLVDGRKVVLNDFVNRILGGTVAGAVTSLHGVNQDWKEIAIRVKKV